MVKELYAICHKEKHTIFVDDEDYPLLSRHHWNLLPTSSGIYAYTSLHMDNSVRKMTSLSQIIMGSGFHIDHIDRNTLNYQKSNLRPATYQENGWNKGKNKSGSNGKPCTSKYKGVMRIKGEWIVRIKLTKKGVRPAKYLNGGPFKTEEDAARFYNKHIVILRGEWAWVNPLPS